jgi:glycerate kinase
MKIIIAPDKFKHCLDAAAVADAIAAGARDAAPEVRIDLCPMADGGEGTVAAMVAATGGRLHTRRVTGPLPEMKVDAVFGVLGDGKTAIVEMAAASGLALLAPDQRDPLATTTFGTGELLVEAARLGVERIILGIGGSATCDGGVGAAQACGLPVILEDGAPVSPTEPLCGRDLGSIVLIKHGRGSPVERVKIVVACDVRNPLLGINGAAMVFGPQKGATLTTARALDDLLAGLAQRTGTLAFADEPGAGAAGGLGFGMRAWFGATLHRGVEIVAQAVKLADRLRGADLCFTGEGRLDAQSAAGKTVHGVALACRGAAVPCIALAGAVEDDLEPMYSAGLTAALCICDRPMTLEHAMAQTPRLLQITAANVIRAIIACAHGKL